MKRGSVGSSSTNRSPLSLVTEKRGSVGFSSTYRPPLPLDIFSCPAMTLMLGSGIQPFGIKDEVHMSDGVSYNYNGREIPSAALKIILKRLAVTTCEYNVDDVDSGDLTGLIFVSERDRGLETLHIAIRPLNGTPKVFKLSDVFLNIFGISTDVRMEDSSSVAPGSCGGDYIIYVTTKDKNPNPRQPWTAVYKTKLTTGETTRLTPVGQADLSPSVHPSGTKIAVASFQKETGIGWDGEIEDLKTDIFTMDVEAEVPFARTRVITNGGWPTWGSDNVLFFHRKDGKKWGVFKADNIGGCADKISIVRVTSIEIDAMTPAAINATTVAVATILEKYRHIVIFQYSPTDQTYKALMQITQQIRPLADHFNPFVIDGGKRIGYHRCKINDELKGTRDAQMHSNRIASADPDVGVFRVPGIYPTFAKDGSKLAFVDNVFNNVWLADSNGLRIVFTNEVPGNIFCPVWNQDSEKDILYVCRGPSFSANERLDIIAIPKVSEGKGHYQLLTKESNNAFPSTNPKGTKLVFRSTLNMVTKDGKSNPPNTTTGGKPYKNLYIMHKVNKGEYGNNNITRLTLGEWTDTHCQWSPNGEWIVFASSRDSPNKGNVVDNAGLDSGFFAIYLVKADDPAVLVRVGGSAMNGAGHVNHPFFSPDGMSIVVTSDLAGVSADPISLPLFVHSVRPYGDIFIIDLDPEYKDNEKTNSVKNFRRLTHSRYENSTASWSMFSTEDSKAAWNEMLLQIFSLLCPHQHSGGGETWNNTCRRC